MEATNSPEQLPERTAEEIERLCAESGDLVERVMSHLKQAGIHADWEELRAFGRQGLVEAAVRFDPEQGDDFRRYAYFRVKGAMLDGMRKMSTWSRRGYERIVLLRASNSTTQGLSAEQMGEPPDAQQAAGRLQKHMAAVVTAMTTGVFADHTLQRGEVLAVERGQSAEERLAEQQLTRLVREAMDELPPPEDQVIRRFYVEGEKMDTIAEDLGRSRSWVSRVHTRALKRLGARLRTRD